MFRVTLSHRAKIGACADHGRQLRCRAREAIRSGSSSSNFLLPAVPGTARTPPRASSSRAANSSFPASAVEPIPPAASMKARTFAPSGGRHHLSAPHFLDRRVDLDLDLFCRFVNGLRGQMQRTLFSSCSTRPAPRPDIRSAPGNAEREREADDPLPVLGASEILQQVDALAAGTASENPRREVGDQLTGVRVRGVNVTGLVCVPAIGMVPTPGLARRPRRSANNRTAVMNAPTSGWFHAGQHM